MLGKQASIFADARLFFRHHMILSIGEGQLFLKEIPWLLPLVIFLDTGISNRYSLLMELPRPIIALTNPALLPLVDYKDVGAFHTPTPAFIRRDTD